MHRVSWMCVLALTFLGACAGNLHPPDLPMIYASMDATQRVDVLPDGHGSSVVLTQDGYLLTDFHVAGKGDRELLVNVSEDGKPAVAYPAKVVVSDEKSDLSVLKIAYRFPYAPALSCLSQMHEGDEVYLIGYPYEFGRLTGRGAIKALSWTYRDKQDASKHVEHGLVLDIPDGPGNSGGGIFLKRSGDLVGLMQMILPYGTMGEDGGVIYDGRQVVLHIAIQIDTIRALLDRAHIPYRSAPGC